MQSIMLFLWYTYVQTVNTTVAEKGGATPGLSYVPSKPLLRQIQDGNSRRNRRRCPWESAGEVTAAITVSGICR